MEQRIGVAMPVMQSPQTPPQENGDEEVLLFVFGGGLVVVIGAIHAPGRNRADRGNDELISDLCCLGHVFTSHK